MTRTFSARRGFAGGLAVTAVAAGVAWSSSGPVEGVTVAAVMLFAILLVLAAITYGSRETHKP